MPTLSQFDDQTRYNSRTAQANAQLQDQAHQQALAQNQQTGAVGTYSAADTRQQQLQGPQVDSFGQPTAAGILNQQQANQGGNVYAYSPQTGQISGAEAGAMGKPGAQGITPQNPPVENRIMAGGQVAPPEVQRQYESAAKADEASQAQIDYFKTKGERDKIDSAKQNAQPEVLPSSGVPGADAALANLPPEAQFLGPFLQQFQQVMEGTMKDNATTAQSMLDDTRKTYEGIDRRLAGIESDYVKTSEALQGMLDTVRDQNDENLTKQLKAQEDRMEWDRQKIEREMTKQKRRNHDAMVAQIALMGGFGQDAGIRAVMESDAVYDQRMTDLQVEFGIQRTELSAKFSALYLENQNNYVNQTKDNLKELRAGLERIGLQRVSSDQTRQTTETNLISTAWTNQVNLRKELAGKNLEAAEKVATLIVEEKARVADERKQKKVDAYQLFNFAFSNSTDPALRQSALSAMRAAGYELPQDVDLTAQPISMQLAELQKAKDKEKAKSTDPFKYDDPEKRNIMAQAYNAVGNLPVAMQGIQLEYIAGLLDRGDTEGARNAMRGVAVSGLTGKLKDAYSDRTTMISSVRDLDATLSKLVAGDRGLWTQKWEQFKKNANKSQDASYLSVSAQIENVASILIKDRYGANVTDNEFERARQFIPLAGDTVQDALGKMRRLKDYLQTKNDETISVNLGGTEPTAPAPGGGEGYDDDFFNRQFGGKKTTGVSFLDTLAKAHEQHEGYGSAGAKTITAQNNPGALRWSAGQAKFGGQPGNNGFTKFPSYEQGYAALKADLEAKLTGKSRHIDYASGPTLLSYVQVYAPAADRNDPKGYAQALVKQLQKSGYDVDLNTPLSQLASLLS